MTPRGGRKVAPMSDVLTPRQDAFVREYLVDLNGTRAAIRAGFSERSAASTASTLLRNPKVVAAVEAAKAARSERTDITADRVLVELGRLAFVDVSKAFDENGALLKPHDMPEEVRAALAGVDYAKSGDMVARFTDKTRALELVGKHLGMWRDKVEVSGKDGDALTIEVVTLAKAGG